MQKSINGELNELYDIKSEAEASIKRIKKEQRVMVAIHSIAAVFMLLLAIMYAYRQEYIWAGIQTFIAIVNLVLAYIRGTQFEGIIARYKIILAEVDKSIEYYDAIKKFLSS